MCTAHAYLAYLNFAESAKFKTAPGTLNTDWMNGGEWPEV